jgi:hydroxyacylglutathione hydrolase
LQFKSREEFVRQLTANLPVRPEYFSQDAEINRGGASSLAELPEPVTVLPAELKSMLEQGVMALDVRPNAEFISGHVPGSVNIALSGQFATWAATILGLSSRPVLIAGSSEQYSEARMRLARVGIEDPRGFLKDGVEGWKRAGFPLAETPQITVQQLHERLASGPMQVLDVRREPEWQAGRIANATWWPLDNFRVSSPEIDPTAPLAVHCKSGYRSMIACSLLQRAGFQNVVNVIGGFDDWQQAALPVECDAPTAV